MRRLTTERDASFADMCALFIEIVRRWFVATIRVAIRLPLKESETVLTGNGESLLIKLEPHCLRTLFRELKWKEAPAVGFGSIGPVKFKIIHYSFRSVILFERGFGFALRKRGVALGAYGPESRTILLDPQLLWEYSHAFCAELKNRKRFHRRAVFILAHELGHAWYHAKSHWSHEWPRPIRILLSILDLYKWVLGRLYGWAAIAAFSIGTYHFLPHSARDAFVSGIVLFWLTIAFLIGLVEIVHPIIQEFYADHFAEKLVAEHGLLLKNCIRILDLPRDA